jgi:hypothetical protein
MKKGRSVLLCLMLLVVLAECHGLTGAEDWGTTSDALPLWTGSLRFDVDYQASREGNLMATVIATNVGDLGISGSGDLNLVEMRAYRTADRQGEPFWQQSPTTNVRGSAVPVYLPPGGVQGIVERVVFSYEQLPAGTSYFSARLVLHDPPLRTREFPAGEVTKEP